MENGICVTLGYRVRDLSRDLRNALWHHLTQQLDLCVSYKRKLAQYSQLDPCVSYKRKLAQYSQLDPCVSYKRKLAQYSQLDPCVS